MNPPPAKLNHKFTHPANPIVAPDVEDIEVPLLKQRRSLRIWHAGCASGEEVYSMAILLHEEGLLGRTRIYATDLIQTAIDTARKGAYPGEIMKEYTGNYQANGGKAAFSEYYQDGRTHVEMGAKLSKNIVWTQHNLSRYLALDAREKIYRRIR